MRRNEMKRNCACDVRQMLKRSWHASSQTFALIRVQDPTLCNILNRAIEI